MKQNRPQILVLITGVTVYILLCICNCSHPNAGSEVPNERAVVYMPGGSEPATYARVQLVPADHEPGSKSNPSNVFETYTDENGRYSFSGIPPKYYNFLATKDSLASFLDSVYLGDSLFLPSDTLEQTDTFTAQVIMQPNHNPRTVTVQVLGTTSYFTNVDDSGYFTIPDFPPGKYQLRLETTEPYYTPTFETMEIPFDQDTIPRFEMNYTGIPIIRGLEACYDPLSHVITVKWNKADYRFLDSYMVYRDTTGMPGKPSQHHAVISDTVLLDTVKYLCPETGSKKYDFRYRVTVLDSAGDEGEAFGYVECEAVLSLGTPELFHVEKMAFSPNKPFTINIQHSQTLGEIESYYLSIEGADFVRLSGPDTSITLQMPGDTIVESISLIAKVINFNGIQLTDTLYLQSRFEWSKIGDTPVDADGYHSVIFDGNLLLFTETSSPDKCLLWSSPDGVEWSKLSDSLPFIAMEKTPIVFNRQLMILQRDTLQNATIWVSDDGKDWTAHQLDSLPNKDYEADYETWTVINDRIILVNYYPPCLKDNTCTAQSNWSSEDGFTWRRENMNGTTFIDVYDTPTKNFISAEYNGSLVVGGAWRSPYLCYPQWTAYGLRVWESLESKPQWISFPESSEPKRADNYLPKIIEYKNRLFLTARIPVKDSNGIIRTDGSMWVLRDDFTWYLCSGDSPVVFNDANAKANYHSLCVFQNRLFSISDSGVWTVGE